MIVTQNIKINIEKPVSSEQIEAGLKSLGIAPIRWAIVDVEKNSATVCVSFEKRSN